MIRKAVLAATFVVSVIIAAAGSAVGQQTNCPQHFEDGAAPALVNPKLANRTREICYSGYAVLHSGITRTPLWSAEHLTRDRVEGAREMVRKNDFHPDPHLPIGERSELSDYSRSGFDRGHMAPSGDMPDRQSQDESFSLANMVPQNADDNRGLWSDLEQTVRNLARKDGDLFVVTGPIFQGAQLQSLHGRVLVPTSIFKAVYDVKRNQAGAYVARNESGNQFQRISVIELKGLTGIDVFPGLPESVKGVAMDLPSPAAPHRRHRKYEHYGDTANAP
jgi:endonuclease G